MLAPWPHWQTLSVLRGLPQRSLFLLVRILCKLFLQHCMLPDLSPADHAVAVKDELVESVQRLNKQEKRDLLRQIASALQQLATYSPLPAQRVGTRPTSEGGPATTEGGRAATEGGAPPQRVGARAPPVTTTAEPTNPRVLQTKPRTHLRHTRANTPGALPRIQPKPTAAQQRCPPPTNNSTAPALVAPQQKHQNPAPIVIS